MSIPLLIILVALGPFTGIAAAMTLVRVVFPLSVWIAWHFSTRRESK